MTSDEGRHQRPSVARRSSCSGISLKGTLLESTAGGPGGGLTPAFYEPGVNAKLFEPLGVSDVFRQSQTAAGQVRYVNEGTATSGAAGVPEAGLKPELTIVMSEVVEPVKKMRPSCRSATSSPKTHRPCRRI